MIEAYDATLPYRLAAGVAFFVSLGLWDLYRHPQNPTRAKEYLFLLFATVVLTAYGVGHDLLVSSISPPIFSMPRGWRRPIGHFAGRSLVWLPRRATGRD